MGHFSPIDWNGNGRIDNNDDSYFLTMLWQQQEEERRKERISKMVAAIMAQHPDEEDIHVSDQEFQQLCWDTGLKAYEFDHNDIAEIQRRVDDLERFRSSSRRVGDSDRREERISRMVRAFKENNPYKENIEITNCEFEYLCDQENLRMCDFEDRDLKEIQRRLDAQSPTESSW